MSAQLINFLWRYWPVEAIALLTGANFLITRSRPPRPKGPFLRGDFNIGQGSALNVTSNTYQTVALMDFRKDYKLAVVCGLNDNSVDKFDDTRISKSPAFKITGEILEIVVPYQPAMTAPLEAAFNHAVTAQIGKPGYRGFTGKNKKKKHIQFNYQLSVWSEPVLLPRDVNPEDIHKLSDVQRLKGMVIAEEIREGRITRIV